MREGIFRFFTGSTDFEVCCEKSLSDPVSRRGAEKNKHGYLRYFTKGRRHACFLVRKRQSERA